MPSPNADHPARSIETAELLAVGAELLVGDTRDTNSGDLARELTSLGVEVARVTDLPDRLEVVAGALTDALGRVDLVVTTGGLGPTPDDLTRESIALVCGEEPFEDPTIGAWLRDRFERRGLPYADANRKQAWLIPSAAALPNPNGTAPGWWVDRPDGRVIVALPGPPREMHPMWQAEVLPRLRARGLGADRAAETLRLAGIGESMLVPLIGEEALRRRNPEVATYARVDAVDVRVSAVGDGDRTARQLVDEEVARLEPLLGGYVFARGDDGWPQALGTRLAGRSLATAELGTAGLLAAALGNEPWLRLAEVRPAAQGSSTDAPTRAAGVRDRGGADLGLALVATEAGDDMQVVVAVADGAREHVENHTAFLGGEMGRRRAVNLACLTLWRWLDPDTTTDRA
ncbi:MAG: molybdopterin-binding protein [Candidatus Limnocylindrales bacterium]